jgi:hypothetical protein
MPNSKQADAPRWSRSGWLNGVEELRVTYARGGLAADRRAGQGALVQPDVAR